MTEEEKRIGRENINHTKRKFVTITLFNKTKYKLVIWDIYIFFYSFFFIINAMSTMILRTASQFWEI